MASENGRIPIRASIDGVMYGRYPSGDYTPPPSPEELALAAVELAESSGLQEDVDAATTLVNALPAGNTRTTLLGRLADIFVRSRLTFYDAGQASTFNSPAIAPNGLFARSPGADTNYVLDRTLAPNSGWSSVHVKNDLRVIQLFFSVGIASEIVQQYYPGDRPLGLETNNLSISPFGIFSDGEQLSFTDCRECVLAINYQTNPTVYVIVNGTVIFDITLPLTTDISFVLRAHPIAQRQWVYELNTGQDLTNRPMPAGISSALAAYGADTTDFVEGWGGSDTRAAESLATLNITTTPPPAPSIGDSIVINATCIDGNGVDRASEIYWYNDSMNWHNEAAFGRGGSYTFEPTILGYYTIRAVYYDASGRLVEDSIAIDVNGTVTHSGDTVFDISRSHPNIDSISGNQVRFGSNTPYKLSALGTNGNYNNFAYVEFTYLTQDTSAMFGFGLTTEHNGNVMWAGRESGSDPQDGAGAFSSGIIIGDGLSRDDVWNNGAPATPFGLYIGGGRNGFSRTPPTNVIGFAVDMRDRTTNPTVYQFVHDADSGETILRYGFILRYSNSPLFPVAYCNEISNETTGYDVSINGGASAFTHDPRPLLTAAGVDTTGFQYGWTPAEAANQT